jgi:hypothetical protein
MRRDDRGSGGIFFLSLAPPPLPPPPARPAPAAAVREADEAGRFALAALAGVGVGGRDLDRGVAEQLRHLLDAGAGVEQVRGEEVAQPVRRERAREARLSPPLLQRAVDDLLPLDGKARTL